jgi:hypothetical protein
MIGGAITERPSLLHMGTGVRPAACALGLTIVPSVTATSNKPRRRADPRRGRTRNQRGARRIAVFIGAKVRAVYLSFRVSQSGRT